MKHTVVWSGGMDSTLIVCDLIKRNIEFDAIVFDTGHFGVLKDVYEERARFDIMKYLNKEIEVHKVRLDFPLMNGLKGYDGGMFQQPMMITLLSVFGNDNTVYHMGYHKGDDFFSCQYDMLKASDHILKVMGNKNIKFSFPLKFSTKEQIVLTIQDWGLDKLTHFCEYPNRNFATGRCGECTPCKTYENALIMIDVHKRNGCKEYAALNYDHIIFEENKLVCSDNIKVVDLEPQYDGEEVLKCR